MDPFERNQGSYSVFDFGPTIGILGNAASQPDHDLYRPEIEPRIATIKVKTATGGRGTIYITISDIGRVRVVGFIDADGRSNPLDPGADFDYHDFYDSMLDPGVGSLDYPEDETMPITYIDPDPDPGPPLPPLPPLSYTQCETRAGIGPCCSREVVTSINAAYKEMMGVTVTSILLGQFDGLLECMREFFANAEIICAFPDGEPYGKDKPSDLQDNLPPVWTSRKGSKEVLVITKNMSPVEMLGWIAFALALRCGGNVLDAYCISSIVSPVRPDIQWLYNYLNLQGDGSLGRFPKNNSRAFHTGGTKWVVFSAGLGVFMTRDVFRQLTASGQLNNPTVIRGRALMQLSDWPLNPAYTGVKRR